MTRGKNREFIIAGTQNLLKRNYGIDLQDTHEIDSNLSIGENVSILLEKYSLNISTLQDL